MKVSYSHGNPAAPDTESTYRSPVIWLEWHTNSKVANDQNEAGWGNTAKTAAQVTEVHVYADEEGEVNCQAGRVHSNHGIAYPGQRWLVGMSYQADSDATYGQHVSCWGGNLIARFGDCTYVKPPKDCVGLELDVINHADSDTDIPGASATNYTGVWVQAAGPAGKIANTGYLLTGMGQGQGWRFGSVVNAIVTEWVALWNTMYEHAQGLFLQIVATTRWKKILDLRSGNRSRFSVDGAGNVVIGENCLDPTAEDGFLWLPACAGKPVTQREEPYPYAAPVIVDAVNSKLYVRVGKLWKSVQLT